MRDKQTLFDYVYQDLRGQIVSGRLSFGDKLPSMRSLCDLYNVGLRTIKDVLRVLKRGSVYPYRGAEGCDCHI